MSRPYTPRPYAPMVWDFLSANRRSNLWAGMGLGKTSLVETYLEAVYNIGGEDEPTLVVGPKRVAADVWSDEVKKWDHLAGLTVSVMVGTPAERLAALKQPAQVYVINYDNVVWLDEVLGDRWRFGRVVADEATRLKNFRITQGGVRSQALGRHAHSRVRHWINLTGTPSPNGLRDLWGQQWFIDEGRRLGRTFSAFEERWFGYKRITDALSHKPGVHPVIQPGAEREIMARLADCSLTIDPKDWFDIRDPIVNVIEVELCKSARKHYRELERELFTELEGHEVEAFNAAAKSMKLLQCANGAIYLDPLRYGRDEATGEPKAIECDFAKLNALESLLEEQNGNPVLLAYHFRSDATRITRAFPDAIDVATPDGLARAKRGEGRLWIGHPASMGHGVDGLQEHCHTLCFFGHWWDLEQYQQMVERVGPVRQLQAGKDRAVTIHHIVARGTIDEVVMERRLSKRSVQDLLLDYMKARK